MRISDIANVERGVFIFYHQHRIYLLQNAASAVSSGVRAGLDIKDKVKKIPVVDHNTNWRLKE